jgi:hypothetical protein
MRSAGDESSAFEARSSHLEECLHALGLVGRAAATPYGVPFDAQRILEREGLGSERALHHGTFVDDLDHEPDSLGFGCVEDSSRQQEFCRARGSGPRS